MIRSTGTKGRLRQAGNGGHKEQFGVAFDILSDQEFGGGGRSVIDRLMRKNFKRASEGDLPAIRIMLRMIRANLKGRKETYDKGEIIRGDVSDCESEPRNADMAMVILGIAAFDDAALAYAKPREEDAGNWYVRGLRPNRIEPWVFEFAENEGFSSGTDPRRKTRVAEAIIDDDRSDMHTWDTHRDQLMAELMALHGPEATRFKPGVSGNRAGRPRKYAPAYPYDDFLTKAVSLEIGGEVLTMTRLDALVVKLGAMALKNRQIADLIVQLSMHKHEMDWNKVEPEEEILRG